MIHTTIGTVTTRWMMICGMSVPSRFSHWNSRKSGIRKERPGVMRAIMMTMADFSAFRRAMPYPAGTPISSARSVAAPVTSTEFQR